MTTLEIKLSLPDRIASQARAAHADAIVSGDADLQSLGTYDGIPVLSPAQALQRFSA